MTVSIILISCYAIAITCYVAYFRIKGCFKQPFISAIAHKIHIENVLNTMNIGITISDQKGVVVFTNKYELDQHGYTDPNEIIGKSVHIFAPSSKSYPEYYTNTQRVIHDMKTVYSRESVNIRKDGTIFPVEIISQPLYSYDNIPYRLSISRDITTIVQQREQLQQDVQEKKRSEQWLKSINNDLTSQIQDKIDAEHQRVHIQKQYKSLYTLVRRMCDNAPIIIWSKDIRGRYVFANKLFTDVYLKKTTHDIIKKTNQEIFADTFAQTTDIIPVFEQENITQVVEHIQHAEDTVIETGNVFQSQIEMSIYDKIYYIKYLIAPLTNNSDHIIGTVGCATDITDEVELEKQKENMLTKLEKTELQMFIAVTQSPIPIIIYSEKGSIILSSNSFEIHFDIIDTIHDFITYIPELSYIITPSWIDTLYSFGTGHRLHIGSYSLQTISGEHVWDIFATGIGRKNGHGRLILLVASDITDITNTLHENTQLKESYKQLASQMTSFLQKVNDDTEEKLEQEHTVLKITATQHATPQEYMLHRTERFSIINNDTNV